MIPPSGPEDPDDIELDADVTIEARDYVALSVVLLRTVFLPFIIAIAILFIILLLVLLAM